jgi:hypothetical protein
MKKRLVWNTTFSRMKVKQRMLKASRGIEIEFICKFISFLCLLYELRGLKGRGNRSDGGAGFGCAVVGSAAAIWMTMASWTTLGEEGDVDMVMVLCEKRRRVRDVREVHCAPGR